MDNIDRGFIILIAFLIGIVIFFGISLYDVFKYEESAEIIIVEGEITDYEIYEDYFVLEFDNETKYKINYGTGWDANIYDFTVNSKLILKLRKHNYDGMFFDPGKRWNIDSIIKVPEKPLT